MGDGINNNQIQNFFQKDENEDLKNNFIGVFSMDYITRFIKFHELVKEKKKEKFQTRDALVEFFRHSTKKHFIIIR